MTADVKKLQGLLLAQGLPLSELAIKTKVSDETLKGIMEGHAPTFRTLFRLAAVLDVDPFDYVKAEGKSSWSTRQSCKGCSASKACHCGS